MKFTLPNPEIQRLCRDSSTTCSLYRISLYFATQLPSHSKSLSGNRTFKLCYFLIIVAQRNRWKPGLLEMMMMVMPPVDMIMSDKRP